MNQVKELIFLLRKKTKKFDQWLYLGYKNAVNSCCGYELTFNFVEGNTYLLYNRHNSCRKATNCFFFYFFIFIFFNVNTLLSHVTNPCPHIYLHHLCQSYSGSRLGICFFQVGTAAARKTTLYVLCSHKIPRSIQLKRLIIDK